jgi:hypothetical protein
MLRSNKVIVLLYSPFMLSKLESCTRVYALEMVTSQKHPRTIQLFYADDGAICDNHRAFAPGLN